MPLTRRIPQPVDKTKRTCTRCGLTKDVTAFGVAKPGSQNHRTYDGVRMPCRECDNARNGEHSKTAQAAAIRKAWRERKKTDPMHVARIRAEKLRSYYKDVERTREAARRKYEVRTPEQREARKAYCRVYYEAHKAENIEANRKRRATPEGRAAHNASNRKRKVTEVGREQGRIHSQTRRAKKRNAGGTLSRADWRRVKEAFGHLCIYCDADAPLTIDHVVPVSDGGRHDTTNVVPACMPCNLAKGALDILPTLDKLGISRKAFMAKRRASGLIQ